MIKGCQMVDDCDKVLCGIKYLLNLVCGIDILYFNGRLRKLDKTNLDMTFLLMQKLCFKVLIILIFHFCSAFV